MKKRYILFLVMVLGLLSIIGFHKTLLYIPSSVAIPPQASRERVMIAWGRLNEATNLPITDFEYEVTLPKGSDPVEYIEKFIVEREQDGWSINKIQTNQSVYKYVISKSFCDNDKAICEEIIYAKYWFMNVIPNSENDDSITLIVSWWGEEKSNKHASVLNTVQEWARIRYFPVPADKISIQKSGSMFTREYQVSFSAPKEEVRAWLQAQPGTTSVHPTIKDGVEEYTIDPGGGAQFAQILHYIHLNKVVIRVYWS